MQPGFGQHAGDDLLEQYSLGTLRESALASFEEHLLVCPECQERLKESDAYVQAMRAAAAKLRGEPPIGWLASLRVRPLTPAALRPLAAIAAVAALAAGLYWWVGSRSSRLPSQVPVAVVLRAERGVQGGKPVTARHGRPLTLNLDLTGLAAPECCVLEIVDAEGRQAWRVSATPKDERLNVPLVQGLRAGAYWVRIYDSGQPDRLLREYGLRVE